MGALVDPAICPDCRARLGAGNRCTGCGLVLTGPLAAELWETMNRADELVTRLRATSPAAASPYPATRATSATPAQAPPAAAPTRPPDPGDASGPPTCPGPAAALPSGMPGLTVPVVVLSLGGLCLLIAAIVFVAVAWGAIGLTGRTLVLVGLTLIFVIAAVVLTRRRLRGASETLWVIALGMVAIDILGGHAAGFPVLGGLSLRHTAEALGIVLAVTGAAASAYAGSRLRTQLIGGQLIAALGVLIATVAGPWTGEHGAVGALVAVPVLLLLGAGTFRLGLRIVATTAAVLAGMSWLILVGHGLVRLGASASSWYLHLHGWPLLVAALIVGAAAFVRRLGGHELPLAVRATAAGASLVCLGLFALLGIHHAIPAMTGVCVAVVVLAAVTALLPRTWSIPAATLGASVAFALTVMLVTTPLRLLADAPADAPLSAQAHLHPVQELVGWVWPMVAVTVIVMAFAVLRHLRDGARPLTRRAVIGTAPTLALLGVGALVVRADLPAWAPALAYLVALVVAFALCTRADEPATMAASGVAVVVAAGSLLRVAVVSELLTAVALTAIALFAIVTHWLLRRHVTLAATYLAVAVLSGGAALLAWLHYADQSRAVVASALAAYAAIVLLTARFTGRAPSLRITVEACAGVLGLLAIALSDSPTTAVITLTVVGASACLVAIVWTDREPLRWAGSVALLAATLVRWSYHFGFPELITLPAAVVLLVAGYRRMSREPELHSHLALGPGLTLGLLPSLLIALGHPTSVRALVLGLCAVGILVLGARQRWSAPLLAGAVVVALLAIRNLGPVVAAVPRWISLGTVGLLLLVIGVTWEARARNVRTAAQYLRGLV